MKRVLILAAAASFAAAAWASPPRYEYEGQWGSEGRGDGEFDLPCGVALAPNGNVYVVDRGNHRIQYFTPEGSFLGKWGRLGGGYGGFCYPTAVAVAANGYVYVSCPYNTSYGIQYFTSTGSFLGYFSKVDGGGMGISVAPTGNVYVAFRAPPVKYFTPQGSLLGSWGIYSNGNPADVSVSPRNDVYVSLINEVHRVFYFTSSGSFLRSWGRRGSGPGEFEKPFGVAAKAGLVFVVDELNHRCQYFTPSGTYLGLFGSRGTGDGQFRYPKRVAVTKDGGRVYVTDAYNYRVQYFRVANPAVAPASLGRVKALFR
jgi:tripartite motif-containing protein 71